MTDGAGLCCPLPGRAGEATPPGAGPLVRGPAPVRGKRSVAARHRLAQTVQLGVQDLAGALPRHPVPVTLISETSLCVPLIGLWRMPGAPGRECGDWLWREVDRVVG